MLKTKIKIQTFWPLSDHLQCRRW